MLLRFNNGAKGILHCSQICNGDQNGLNFRVYGEKGSLQWRQETPQYLHHKTIEGHSIYQPGVGKLSDAANYNSRIPFGHPEGYLEAFANIYRNFARTVRKNIDGKKPTALELDFPTIDDGIRGLQFVEAAIKSGKANAKWVKL
jgi:predicted dehydrogenase